jgi:hypothetical protein
MSLDTYANLKQEIIEWSHRGDIDGKVDTFIDIAETEMFSNPEQVLKIRAMEQDTTDAASTSSRLLALPTDYQSFRGLKLVFSDVTYYPVFKTPEQMVRIDTTGRPLFFTITDQIEFDRVPDQAYTVEFQYYAVPTALSTSNTTNSVLTNHPQIYLFGALWACFEYATDDIQANKWYVRFMAAIVGANKKDKEGRYGPNPAMTVEGSTP